MKIALAQLNPTVGNITGNCALVEDMAQQAVAAGAELLVCPELVVSGYPPRDLLVREGFVERCDAAVEQLAGRLPDGLGVLVGHPTRKDVPASRIANAASLLAGGRRVATIRKHLLPNYDVFDERRYFRAADTVAPVAFGGLKLGVHICEDAWWADPETHYDREPNRYFDPVAALAEAGADVLINLSASPFEIDKRSRRLDLMRTHAVTHGLPFVFLNQTGGNDDLVFDGASFCLSARGEVVLQMENFESSLSVFDSEDTTVATPPAASREGEILDALVLGLRDYLAKCGFTDCVLGLSGGIDSALACYVAARAVGPERVHALLMPSRYSSDHSVSDAEQLARTLGVDHEVIPIDGIHTAYEGTPVIADDLSSQPTGLAEQNLQARIRGAIVMVRSNRHGWLALATGNKSELAVGYCTLYGDMCGGFAVLSDVLKRDVYAVSRYINQEREQREVIPWSVIEKPPSAELAPNQVDQDTLPPYPVLDAILEALIEEEAAISSLVDQFPRETVEWVARRVDRNEFKRRQMPPGIKLSSRAFGTGRRMPMAARIEYD